MTHGGRVFFTDINEELGLKTHQALVDEFGAGRVEFSVHDVVSMESWRLVWTRAETFFSDTGGVEALVNNAGVYLSGDQDWKRNVIDVNITGVMHGTELALEKMKTGVIVQVSLTHASHVSFLIVDVSGWICGLHGEEHCSWSLHLI